MRFEDWKYPAIEKGQLTTYNWVVEDCVQIGSHCSIYSVSTIDNKEGEVILKRNCRIGSHSVIMPNVTIGENSIIGAFTFVNRNIPANVIAFGIPVEIIKNIKKDK
jgi:acetyltransferase-like isoleucine patch superfamily enzyme